MTSVITWKRLNKNLDKNLEKNLEIILFEKSNEISLLCQT